MGHHPIRARIAAAAGDGVRLVVLDFGSVPLLDLSAARMPASVAEALDRDGVELRLAQVVGQVRDVLRTAVPTPIYPTIATAVAAPPQAT